MGGGDSPPRPPFFARRRSAKSETCPRARASAVPGGGRTWGLHSRRSSPATQMAARAPPPTGHAAPLFRRSMRAARRTRTLTHDLHNPEEKPGAVVLVHARATPSKTKSAAKIPPWQFLDWHLFRPHTTIVPPPPVPTLHLSLTPCRSRRGSVFALLCGRRVPPPSA
jgi:hypothetical protein